MPKAQRTIVIDRPVDQVFAFFCDPSNDLKWRTHAKEIAADGPPRVGSTIHQVIEGPGGRGIPADIRVTAYDPPSRYGFQVIGGPVRPVGEFRFTPTGNATQVSFSLAADLGGMKKWLMSRPVQKSMEAEMASLDKAKTIIEAG
ncbi:MAG: hypothetical protein QOK30_1749 [Nocardioidaceae bacterium]|jgi:uncharacterized protein YndB with AHSA1/START domain|nr:hypothetical protein [Nocardioidaceae bacterium]